MARQGGAQRGYLGLVVSVAAVALAGYVGYIVYPRFDLPAVEGAALLGLAAVAGVASFFSPCSFPLLVALLGRQAAVPPPGDGAEAPPAVFGGALAVGAAIFMVLAGVVIGLGGEALFAGVTFASPAGITIRIIVGALLVLLGLIQVGVLPISFHRAEAVLAPLTRSHARLRRRRPVLGFGMMGFGYVLAGFG